MPVGFGAAGLPMGMQLIGKPRGDLALLRLAHAYEPASKPTRSSTGLPDFDAACRRAAILATWNGATRGSVVPVVKSTAG